jgi:SAM-dependent methyltransferase
MQGVSARSPVRSSDKALIEAANLAYHEAEASLYDASHPEILRCERTNWEVFSRRYLSNRNRPISVLDVGAGTGFVGSVLAEHLTSEDVYVGCDISREMLARLEDNMREATCAVLTVVAPADSLPFSGASFDVIVINSALHHVLDPIAALHEISRVLKPSGTFACMHEPNIRFAESPFSRAVARFSSFVASRLDRSARPPKSRPDYGPVFAHVNERLVVHGIIDTPLSTTEIQALVDVHSPTARGKYEVVGFDPYDWTKTVFHGWQKLEMKTYNQLGKLDPTAFLWRRTAERILGVLRPRAGSLFSLVFRRPRQLG